MTVLEDSKRKSQTSNESSNDARPQRDAVREIIEKALAEIEKNLSETATSKSTHRKKQLAYISRKKRRVEENLKGWERAKTLQLGQEVIRRNSTTHIEAIELLKWVPYVWLAGPPKLAYAYPYLTLEIRPKQRLEFPRPIYPLGALVKWKKETALVVGINANGAIKVRNSRATSGWLQMSLTPR